MKFLAILAYCMVWMFTLIAALFFNVLAALGIAVGGCAIFVALLLVLFPPLVAFE